MTRSTLGTLALALIVAGRLAADPATYASPQDALDAMIQALEAQDRDTVMTVFGEESQDFLLADDPAEDEANRLTLIGLYYEGYRMEPQEDGSVVLALGADGWPFPIPLARDGESWSFDIDAGREEVKDREIGLNELEVIDLMDAYVDVQAVYRLQDQDGDGVMEFARQIISSSEDAKDGLFWPDQNSPLGELVARASMDGYSDGDNDYPPEPYEGYYYRILTAQTDAAPGGAMNYLVNENMVGGHALLAVPAVFGETGIHSFMVSENGIILQAILGEDTLEKAAQIEAYDPTEEWTPFTE
jgi:hypothetical protein